MHTFKSGDRVVIVNMTIGGRFIVEGRATVKRPLRRTEEYYSVVFDNSAGSYERFIDPAAQADPEEFVRKLNELSPVKARF
jgi:hypothetical protein